jgi:hypothetical protein
MMRLAISAARSTCDLGKPRTDYYRQPASSRPQCDHPRLCPGPGLYCLYAGLLEERPENLARVRIFDDRRGLDGQEFSPFRYPGVERFGIRSFGYGTAFAAHAMPPTNELYVCRRHASGGHSQYSRLSWNSRPMLRRGRFRGTRACWWADGPSEAKGHLGDLRSPHARAGSLQPRNRQQVEIVRFGEVA